MGVRASCYPHVRDVSNELDLASPQGLAWHLERGQPMLGRKATQEPAVSPRNLIEFLQGRADTKQFRAWGQMDALGSVLEARARDSRGRRPRSEGAAGWWQWKYDWLKFMTQPLVATMTALHCDGMLDWSAVPGTGAAGEYFQLIVSAGRGSSRSTISEGADWLEAMHKDHLPPYLSFPFGLFNYARGEGYVDTFLVGMMGRKRVVLLPPSCCPDPDNEGTVDLATAPPALRAIGKLTMEEGGWDSLDRFAEKSGGAAFTIDPSSYCFVPAGWWHVVKPLHDLTFIVSPSFMRGVLGDAAAAAEIEELNP